MKSIFHIAQLSEWESARLKGVYFPKEPAHCDYIHFSFDFQIKEVANRLFRGRNDLIILEVDSALVREYLKIEPPHGGYPHLYRPLKISEVVSVYPLMEAGAGGFVSLDKIEAGARRGPAGKT